MDNKFKITIAVVMICLFAVMGYTIKQQNDIIKALSANAEQQRFLKDDITAVKSTLLTSADLDKKLASVNMDLETLKKDLNKTGSDVSAILIVTNKTPGSDKKGQPSTGYYPIPAENPSKDPVTPSGPIASTCGPDCATDTYGYYNKVPYYRLSESLGSLSVPLGEVSFNMREANPWNEKVYGRTYSSSVVIATDAAGVKTAYAKMTIQPNDGSNKTYSLPETQVQFYERLPESKFYLLNLRASFGLDLGYSSKPGFVYGPTAQIFISSYGKYKHKPDWYIAGLGINYDINNSDYNFALSPFAYKITGDDSMFQNINIGPTIAIDLHGNISGFIGFKLSL